MNATIINIGRQFGSGGRRVAAALGVRLGIPVYDNELIAEAAQKSGFSKDLFMQRDEHKSNFTLSNLFGIGGGSLVARLMGIQRFDDAKRSARSAHTERLRSRFSILSWSACSWIRCCPFSALPTPPSGMPAAIPPSSL